MKKIAIIAVVGLGFLFSCSLDSDEFQGPITSKINVTMLEDVSGEDPFFQILFESTNLYECSNYNILMTVDADENNLDIVFNEIYKNSTCRSETGPAYNVYSFSKIVNGTYNLSLKVKDKPASTGTLVISDTGYTLDMTESDDFAFVNPQVYRMPEGILWGSIQKYSESQQANTLVDNFFDLLSDNGLADTALVKGDYTYFLIDEENKVSLRRANATPAGTSAFVFYLDEDSVSRNNLKIAISDFRGKYSQYVKVDMFDWIGTIY
ncbi:MAG: hypothetical protein RIG68_19400 [Imperialibacter sp.]|uniref:hypothetical protein n=1 Tax=Imperialibacter sp. TaxID=2038411 RepID=UPI0032EFEE16